jgi:hypothetical protein
MTMNDNDRAQIEEALGRPLTAAELTVVSDLSAMPASHLDVMERLFDRNGIAALYYMRAVTNDIDPSTLRRYVHDFDSVIAERHKPTGLRAQRLYENELGRPLTADELTPPGNLHGISEPQRAVVRLLARKDTGIALAYIHDLAPLASTQERVVFLETLPRS